jgi:ABC-type branched-subunit amino acid transport system ATPase component
VSILIEAKDLSAGYQGVPVVRDVNLRVEEGEVVVLLGPNGAGKTTTCMTLAGALTPIAGEVRSEGSVTRESVFKRVRRGMGLLPERRAIFNSLSVRDNLRLGRSSVESVLELFPELEKRLGVRAGLLSGGEQQMLALGRVLAAKPAVILVDELSFGLAPIVVTRLLNALRAQAREGTGVLLIEQHVHTALKYADRAYLLKRGQLVFEGRSEDMAADQDRLAELYL